MENAAWFWITLNLELKWSNHYHKLKNLNTQIAKLSLTVSRKHFLLMLKKFCLNHYLHFRYLGMKICFVLEYWAKLISTNLILEWLVISSWPPKKNWILIFLGKTLFLLQKVLIFSNQLLMTILSWAKVPLIYHWLTKCWPLPPLS